MDSTSEPTVVLESNTIRLENDQSNSVPESNLVAYNCAYDGVTNSVAQLVNTTTGEVECELGYHLGEVWQKRKDEPRVHLGDMIPSEANFTFVTMEKVEDDIYSFAGHFNTGRGFRMWKNHELVEVQCGNIESRLRGLGAVRYVSSRSSQFEKVFFLGTGLGIYNASVLTLTVTLDPATRTVAQASLQLFAYFKGSIGPFGIEFDVTGFKLINYLDYDGGKLRLYDLTIIEPGTETSSAIATEITVPDLTNILGSEFLKDALLAKFNAIHTPNKWLTTIGNWTKLFPIRLIDPDAYDGELNAMGEPHGFGVQFIRSKKAVYEGEWKNGYRTGKGKLLNFATGEVEFEGEFWKNERIGRGTEFKDKEIFTGNFKDDVRSGFGMIEVLKNCKIGGVPLGAGSTVNGFFKNGRLHGLARIVYPIHSELKLDFPVGSIAAFQNNVCHGEFWFHSLMTESTLQTCPKDTSPPELDGNVVPLISEDGSSRFDSPVCWICLNSHSSDSIVSCDLCGFNAHSTCFVGGQTGKQMCPFEKKSTRPLSVVNTAKRMNKMPLAVRNENVSRDSKQTAKQQKSSSNKISSTPTPKAFSEQDAKAKGASDALVDHGRIREAKLLEREKIQKEKKEVQFREEWAERRRWNAEENELKTALAQSVDQLEEMKKLRDELFNEVGLVFKFDVTNADDESLVKHKKRLWDLLESLGHEL